MKKVIYSILLIFSSVMLLSTLNNGIGKGYMCFTTNFGHCEFAQITNTIWGYFIDIFHYLLGLHYVFGIDFASILTVILFLSLAVFSFSQIFSLKISLKLKNNHDKQITNS